MITTLTDLKAYLETGKVSLVYHRNPKYLAEWLDKPRSIKTRGKAWVFDNGAVIDAPTKSQIFFEENGFYLAPLGDIICRYKYIG